MQAKLSRQFHVAPAQLDGWAQHVIAAFDAALATMPAPSDLPLGPQSAPAYGQREKAAMRDLLSRFICIPVDKLSNNMFLACRCVLADAQVTEISGGLADQDATFQVADLTA